MQSNATTVKQYFDELPAERKAAMTKLWKIIKKNLPKGFKEAMGHGMPGFEVPYSIYPAGYHCLPKEPLPFMGLASQKHFIAVYHMGIYADPKLLTWFQKEFAKRSKTKLDMGKSCVRLKKMDQIPFELFGELASKMTVEEWIKLYEKELKR